MEEKTRYWFDTEFIEDGKTIELLSIGMVCEDGRKLYCENGLANLTKANDFVKENVIPHLWRTKSKELGFQPAEAKEFVTSGGFGGNFSPNLIRDTLSSFVHTGENKPEFWAYYADYDWVVLCQLFGTMMDLPEGWPMFCMDVKQYAVMFGDPELPKQESTEHHALEDARWTKKAWEFLHDKKDFI